MNIACDTPRSLKILNSLAFDEFSPVLEINNYTRNIDAGPSSLQAQASPITSVSSASSGVQSYIEELHCLELSAKHSLEESWENIHRQHLESDAKHAKETRLLLHELWEQLEQDVKIAHKNLSSNAADAVPASGTRNLSGCQLSPIPSLAAAGELNHMLVDKFEDAARIGQDISGAIATCERESHVRSERRRLQRLTEKLRESLILICTCDAEKDVMEKRLQAANKKRRQEISKADRILDAIHSERRWLQQLYRSSINEYHKTQQLKSQYMKKNSILSAATPRVTSPLPSRRQHHTSPTLRDPFSSLRTTTKRSASDAARSVVSPQDTHPGHRVFTPRF